MKFHIIGDSHASEVTWGGVRVWIDIVCHHLGPMTCASFGITRPMIEVEKEDWVCFCFGEIDCRDHLGKVEDYKETTNKIVENYFDTVNQYICTKKYIFSVVPANIQSTAAGDPWPCVGTDEERREYVRYFNERLKRCEEHGIIFLDVHDKYADENGFFNLKYRDHCVHIKDPIFINEFLCQH